MSADTKYDKKGTFNRQNFTLCKMKIRFKQ